ncbi:MAG: MarR family transcriptional regulator [Herpetosiphonaceae bacterium]|nr:MarR family transcriptional regulator [Herpetosiphonaceae bacterium]
MPDQTTTSPQLTSLLRTVSRLIGRRAMGETLNLILGADLSVSQLAALIVVQREGALSLTALSAGLSMSLSNTSYLTDQLVKRGLLTRCEDPADRRQKVIALSGAATELLDQIVHVRITSIEDTMVAVPIELRQQLEAILAQVVPYLQPLPPV